MLTNLILFSMLATTGPSAIPQACATTFDEVLEKHLGAIQSRDLAAYMSTLGDYDGKLMVLPDGSMWTSTDAARDGHQQWFSDQTWEFNAEQMSRDVRDSFGLVVYRVTVDRPEKPGSPFLLSMLFAPDEAGCWTLIHDQNTLLPVGN